MTPRLQNGQFPKGTSGNPKGRPRGSNLEVKQLAAQLVRSRAYLDLLEQRLLTGTLHPALERLLWHYAHGKPVERVQVSGDDGPRPFVVTDWRGEVLSAVILGVGSFSRAGDGESFTFTPAVPTTPAPAIDDTPDDAA